MAGRSDYMEPNEYFMEVAKLAAKRSKDPKTQVGACIVNRDKVVVSIGHNHMPKDSDGFFWAGKEENPYNNKLMYVVHAEMSAILKRTIADISGCTMYVTFFPCNECSKAIAETGIKEVVYYDDNPGEYIQCSQIIFDRVGIQYRR
ncbi:deoxycytidylate deaminase isoform X2 [Diabrotica virgifera virgifera]|uniref:dCMP deaminase n=1 Tax=Diabrotica virgifera virgifera TaxID=50390 RepID=A0A6P7FNQ2_DIAVI|nr:deoxycytidylate deaminase isoform X2 [Diabrotica virgifera virgifera]